MRLILNGINGKYLREITENAVENCELVEAAVAYASDESLLFDWCWNNNIPLRFYGRFDDTVPVAVRVLQKFLSRRSANYACKLLNRFHAKVIWWHGVGAYVGSANLSDAAWYTNVEAGCFFDETEMLASGADLQLRDFFRRIDEYASAALGKAIEWWSGLVAAPTSEQITLQEWGPLLREMLSRDRIRLLSETDFEGVCHRVWSIQDHARRMANATLGLPEGTKHNMPTKTDALAKFLWGRRAPNGANVLEVLHQVIYGGSDENLPTRLWEATAEGSWKIEHLGISALGELVGWALPERFPPRNNRTSKSLRSLGFQVGVHG